MSKCLILIVIVLIGLVEVPKVSCVTNKDIDLTSVPGTNIGIIIGDSGKGSGFIAGPQRHIFTCAHVAEKGTFIFIGPSTSNSGIHLKLLYYLPKYDLSVFRSSFSIANMPLLEFGDLKKIRPGDTIGYEGLDTRINGINLKYATVSSIGSVLNDGAIIDFIEFQGEGNPGYSGGPVFDKAGHVIAMMREAWTKKGVKGGPEILMNRAFSIEILSILENEVYSSSSTENNTPIDWDKLKILLNTNIKE